VAAVAGDRFVVRSYSPVTTIGGGVIVDPMPAKHKRSSAAVLEEFRLLTGGSEAERVAVVMARAGICGITEPSSDPPDGDPPGGTPQASGGDVRRQGGHPG
jgi:selenocysteine-specific elongation factor